MIKFLLSILTRPWFYKAFVYACLVILLAIAGYGVYSWWVGPKIEIVTAPGNTKLVYVDRPVLQTKEVVKYVTDKAEVQKVLMENAYLQNQVTMLNETIAALKTSGEGKIVYKDVPGPTQIVHQGEFKDWRLTFTFQDENAKYTLDQKFEAIATAGRDKEGKPTSSVKLFEIGPGELRTPMTNTQVTVVAATGGGKHWFLSPSIQAGAAFLQDKQYGGIVGVQWLKRGYTKAAEDSIYSIATPAVFVGSKSEIGILPVSFNFGRVPHQPFKDLWLSPFVSQSRVGVAVTATF